MIYSVNIAVQVAAHTHTLSLSPCVPYFSFLLLGSLVSHSWTCVLPFFSSSLVASLFIALLCSLILSPPLHHYPSSSPCISVVAPPPTRQQGWIWIYMCVCVCVSISAGGGSREGCSLGKWRTACSLLILENRQCFIIIINSS